MYSDYKTTTTYFIVIIAFIYSVYLNRPEMASVIILPLILMWLILKTNSKERIKDIIDILKSKWSKDV